MRKARGLSVSQAAHDIGRSIVTLLGAWERGRPPSGRWAPAITRALALNEDDLVERIDPREVKKMREALVLHRIDAETGEPLPAREPMVPIPTDEPAGRRAQS
jgi:hypothetical protein